MRIYQKIYLCFFKVAINKICAGDLTGCVDFEEKAFNIFGIDKAPKRKVNIIYAGVMIYFSWCMGRSIGSSNRYK